MHHDTIAAVATPSGNGGVGVLRISGTRTQTIAKRMLNAATLPPRVATLLPFYNAQEEMIDQGLALWFPAPHSFTGEDVLELHGHGGAVVMHMLLQAAHTLGARLAAPGEFSERAFLNDKMDLAQAEAIADLIESGSEMAAKSALRVLQGDFSAAINDLQAQLTHIRMYVESAIDFAEEEIDFLSDGKVQSLVEDLLCRFTRILRTARQGNALREGMVVVIAGRPNAGKSSLLNRLVGEETAIVTDIPGTTRDILKAYIHIDGMPLHILDTAGIRESDNAIEQEGVRRAIAAVQKADRILLVVDDAWPPAEIQAEQQTFAQYQVPLTLLRNKIDLTGDAAGQRGDSANTQIGISAKHNLGIDAVRDHLKQCMGLETLEEGVFMARRRHIDALTQAEAFIRTGLQQLVEHQAGELLAEDCRQAQRQLSTITGEFTSDDLLGEIFSRFCIGK